MGGCQKPGRECIFRSAAEGRALHLGLGRCAFQERACEFAARQCPGEREQGRLSHPVGAGDVPGMLPKGSNSTSLEGTPRIASVVIPELSELLLPWGYPKGGSGVSQQGAAKALGKGSL